MPGKLKRQPLNMDYGISYKDGNAYVIFTNKITGDKGDIYSKVTYTIYKDGDIEVSAAVDIGSKYVHVPRVGSFVAPKGLNYIGMVEAPERVVIGNSLHQWKYKSTVRAPTSPLCLLAIMVAMLILDGLA